MRPCVVFTDLIAFAGSIVDEQPETARSEARFLVRANGREAWYPDHMVSVWDTKREAEDHVAEIRGSAKAARRYL